MLQSLQDAERQIRLLRLLPGKQDKTVRVEMTVHNRDEAPDYFAISYMWGDSPRKKLLVLNGELMAVRENCYYALWQTRIHYSGLMIWIDSICIDQTNLKEKSHQVRMMTTVYQQARLVLVCLGPVVDDIDHITAFAPELESNDMDAAIMSTYIQRMTVRKERDAPLPTTLTTRFLRRLEPGPDYTPSIADRFQKACQQLSSRPYWSRLWVAQEVVLSGHKVLLYNKINLVDADN